MPDTAAVEQDSCPPSPDRGDDMGTHNGMHLRSLSMDRGSPRLPCDRSLTPLDVRRFTDKSTRWELHAPTNLILHAPAANCYPCDTYYQHYSHAVNGSNPSLVTVLRGHASQHEKYICEAAACAVAKFASLSDMFTPATHSAIHATHQDEQTRALATENSELRASLALLEERIAELESGMDDGRERR
ncbi:hypothetical protein JAAARDRAFT_192855 [Jaapia argillacea MUCL 33604]|uniref:Uncharacterized protein n=1 Tax=Jaapia argillacea MUCL 33604 TaxID=933084 RepID=A0A067PX06_9AGAM|nr:hypothetical protein JAAARDRAFT_192855 [Jaapia argillacea MUCL 33604]